MYSLLEFLIIKSQESLKTQEEKALHGKVLEFLLLDTIKTIF